ncbi:MAG TPA: endolytic transglycosylase MltG [Pyrinomonadaceae bacterium]|nr:endolytic transglycosylase MltG [Pyrinomonadaceae bacterium]
MKRTLAAVFIILLCLVLAAAGAAYWIFSSVKTAHEHTHSAEFIRIEKGSTPRQIIDRLSSEGIISSSAAANLYLRLFGDSQGLQAGVYQFKSPISTLEVLKQLEKGQDLTVKLTIPEGFTRFDIAKRMAEKFGSLEVLDGDAPREPFASEPDILKMMDDTSLISDISPRATSLEGYMYPTTYTFPRDAKAGDVIRAMVEQFRKFWKPEWTAAASAKGRTPNEIVTIASLIETETSVESERPVVASVIYNRLGRGIPLGIDQTNVYIAKMQGRWDGVINKSDLAVDSPYNTRIHVGLPPGPISSVTESSIRAALDPAQTDFLYYVRNVDANDGSHWFYASAVEFERGKAKYQKWLASQR